jgi:hypothetical protein
MPSPRPSNAPRRMSAMANEVSNSTTLMIEITINATVSAGRCGAASYSRVERASVCARFRPTTWPTMAPGPLSTSGTSSLNSASHWSTSTDVSPSRIAGHSRFSTARA